MPWNIAPLILKPYIDIFLFNVKHKVIIDAIILPPKEIKKALPNPVNNNALNKTRKSPNITYLLRPYKYKIINPIALAKPNFAPAKKGTPITSPMVGTFYKAPSPDSEPFVSVGSTVSSGDVVCIVEAMKMMNEIESEVSGKVVEICVEDGQPVEFGQVLMYVE